MIVQLDPEHPQPRRIDELVDRFEQDEVLAYPTDTVYGIGASIFSHDAIVRLRRLISEVKDEPEHSPLSFLCEDISMVSEYTHVSDRDYKLLRRLMPGPYTVILEATRGVPAVMRKHRETVGVRVPQHPILNRLVERLRHPIVTTSAVTDEGELIPDPWTLEDLFDHLVDVVVDGGYVFPEESTVIDLSGEVPVLIREGKGPVEELEFIEVVEEEDRREAEEPPGA